MGAFRLGQVSCKTGVPVLHLYFGIQFSAIDINPLLQLFTFSISYLVLIYINPFVQLFTFSILQLQLRIGKMDFFYQNVQDEVISEPMTVPTPVLQKTGFNLRVKVTVHMRLNLLQQSL